MTKKPAPQNYVVNDIEYTLVEGAIRINGRIYAPTANVPDNDYNHVMEVATLVLQVYAESRVPMFKEQLIRLLSDRFPVRRILKMAEDGGFIQRLAGTQGENTQYIPGNKGN